MAGKAVLDASATIAYILRETPWEKVQPFLGDAFMSTVNASEVISDLLNRNWSLEFSLETLTGLDITIVPHDFAQAVKVAEIKKQLPRKTAISRADCACFALAEILDLPILTTDKNWTTLNLQLDIQQLR